jgi:hypothetical protein
MARLRVLLTGEMGDDRRLAVIVARGTMTLGKNGNPDK